MARPAGTVRLRPPCYIRVQGIKDIGRLACAFERAPIPIFSMEAESPSKLAVQMDMFMGRPIFYYCEAEGIRHFLAYRNAGGVEEVLFTDSASNPAYIYSPLIRMHKIPRVFQRGVERHYSRGQKFLCSEVKDLATLAKVCSYKTLFEEPPLPLFAYKCGGSCVLGCFTRMDDYEASSIFFYILLPDPLPSDFLRFSSRNMAETGFVTKLDEHGYVFIKIIRLSEEHPLVEIN